MTRKKTCRKSYHETSCWDSLEHELRYKSDADFTEEMADELLECAQLSADLDNRMAELRKKCFRRTYCERGYKK